MALDPLLYIRTVQDDGVALLRGMRGSSEKLKRLTAPGLGATSLHVRQLPGSPLMPTAVLLPSVRT